jgi:hypothetical protein
MLHWDGVAWSERTPPPNPVVALWGTDSTHLFAVDSTNHILRFDGSTWSSTVSPAGPSQLHALSGTALDDVWAVGDAGTVLHFDGTRWIDSPSGSAANLLSVWARARNDVFAAGEGGTVLRGDGSVWRPQTSGASGTLTAIWGSGPDDVYAVGSSTLGSESVHFDGQHWFPIWFTNAGLTGIWGSGPQDVYVTGIGGLIYHFDGTDWSAFDDGLTMPLYGIAGSAANDIWAVGPYTILHRRF